MRPGIAYLVETTDTVNGVGDTIKVDTETQVFVTEKSVKQSEFYQAQAVGLAPEIVLEIAITDYSQQRIVIYNDIRYRLIRTYKKSQDRLEITLERIVNGVN